MMTGESTFVHRHSAHCESGSTSNLLFNHGLDVSEAVVFGIGSGLFFAYFPFLKVHGIPLVTFRSAPGQVLKKTSKRLGLSIESARFKSPEKAMDALDALVDKGIPVGLQAGVFWLPYFPDALRFHFNAHTLIVYGRKNGDYLISDPVFESPVTCSRDDLALARFAQGALAPRGKMYHLTAEREEFDLAEAIRKGIRETAKRMANTPFPLIGTKGIRFFAASVRKWPKKLGPRRAALYLGNAIRMQEEIGTGGGGFRLMYAAFLEQASSILGMSDLQGISSRMTDVGDKWRDFAASAARICKKRSSDSDNYNRLYEILHDCARKEDAIFRDLREAIR